MNQLRSIINLAEGTIKVDCSLYETWRMRLKRKNKTEAAPWGVLWKKVFLEISPNLQENTSAKPSFYLRFQDEDWNVIKKETLTQVFSCKFWQIFNNTFLTEYLRLTVSDRRNMKFPVYLIWRETITESLSFRSSNPHWVDMKNWHQDK